MSTALVINSSILGDASVSRHLVDATVDGLRRRDPALRVVARDLAEAPVPHLTPASIAAIGGGATETPEQAEALALADELVAELKSADTIVIGAPMYNFGIPSSLKAWFDYVLRAGITFRYTETGPEGLLKGKSRDRRGVAEAVSTARARPPAMDSQEPHLRTLLGFIGIRT